jgi:hypothetical protein
MNYSGGRLEKPESGWFSPVRTWCTGQSGAPDHNTLGFFAPLDLIPNLNIYWFVLNLCAPVEHIF